MKSVLPKFEWENRHLRDLGSLKVRGRQWVVEGDATAFVPPEGAGYDPDLSVLFGAGDSCDSGERVAIAHEYMNSL